MNIEILLKDFTNKKGGINTKKIKKPENSIYLEFLIRLTDFLPKDINLRFRFNYIKEGFIGVPKLCKKCGKILYNVKTTFCSSVCSNTDEDEIIKMKATWNSKNKIEHSKIQSKRKKTNLEKYGIDIASKLPEIIEKNKNTHFNNWGNYAIKTEIISNKRKQTCIDKWGGVGMGSNIIFEKIKNTNIEKYGVEYFSKTDNWLEKCKTTCLKKYGKDWVSKVDEINKKQQSGGYSWYDFEFPSGRVHRVQGYEPKVLIDLLTKYNEVDIVVGVENIIKEIGIIKYTHDNGEHRYYPDIYIKSENLIIEVKSQYTFNKEKEKNLLKRKAILEKGINFKFIIL